MTTTTARRADRRAMLALIALADLPTPTSIAFHLYDDGSGILSLRLDSLAAGLAWSTLLGGATDTSLNDGDGRRYLHEGLIRWHGWTVAVLASDPPAGLAGRLDEPTKAALALVAGQVAP